jgi:hypothetical protein
MPFVGAEIGVEVQRHHDHAVSTRGGWKRLLADLRVLVAAVHRCILDPAALGGRRPLVMRPSRTQLHAPYPTVFPRLRGAPSSCVQKPRLMTEDAAVPLLPVPDV